jgi:hypothetical protein
MPVEAVQHFARMRGGAQAQLMLTRDDQEKEAYYIVKFQNNPQHRRILANELLASALLRELHFPTAPGEIVHVSDELLRACPGLYVETGGRREPCAAGLQFGSCCPDDPSRLPVYDYLPDSLLRQVSNVDSFLGMVAFDKWVSNANGRQAIFYRDRESRRFEVRMIDHGFAFRAQHWNFEDRPLVGIYPRPWLYEGVSGYNSFEPWLTAITECSLEVLDLVKRRVPFEWWYDDDLEALDRLMLELYDRRKRVPELLRAAKRAARDPFPNWR